MTSQTRTFSLSVALERAPDVRGQWTAHCLDVDVVTQGDSLRHAYTMAREAVEMVILDDLNAGREPTARSAPKEEWEAVHAKLRAASPKAQLYTLDELFEREESIHVALAPLMLNFHRVAAPAPSFEEMGPVPAMAA